MYVFSGGQNANLIVSRVLINADEAGSYTFSNSVQTSRADILQQSRLGLNATYSGLGKRLAGILQLKCCNIRKIQLRMASFLPYVTSTEINALMIAGLHGSVAILHWLSTPMVGITR